MSDYYLHKVRKRRDRRYGAHPVIAQRSLKGTFATLFIDLGQHEGKSFNYFSMSIQLFDELIGKTESKLRVSNLKKKRY
jgi:hypothetical protein